MNKSLCLLILLSIFVNIRSAGADGTLTELINPGSPKRKANEQLERSKNAKLLKEDGQAAVNAPDEKTEETKNCVICFSHLKDEKNEIVALPFTGEENKTCGHKYHKDCLYGWVKKHKNCPICRTLVTIEVPYSLGELIEEEYPPPALSPFLAYSVSLTKKNIDSLEGFQKQPKDCINKLTLTTNRISNIPVGFLAHFSKLTHLSFYNNRISELHPGMFKDASSLQTLILSFNGIKKLPAGAFKGTKLSTLSLYGNCIEEIDDNAFSKDETEDRLPLEEVNLSNNKMQTLNEKAFKDMKTLKCLKFKKNHLYRWDDRNAIEETLPAECTIQYE